MWKFKPFATKEQTGLEGRTIDVGSTRITVQNAIAEGGFSSVYLARDAMSPSKQYALKYMICQDGESLDLAAKEISVLKRLRGHPNVVELVTHVVLDMGQKKEVMLLMEFCEKSLVSVLENRGAGYFQEKQVLLIFRDVCNAVFAMHSQSPPIAHRDLKVENVLLGSDGAWKLCDFGSTSTNHKCFDRPEEMGIEEDNIRKYTTPAYRAPEMWDLYRKDVISEKVDIWALGCLLYRICYFKLAFDGESKLQILNGSYRIPDLPKYSDPLTSLLKDMLESSPDARPDITQVWFRVNDLLPSEFQKHLPEGSNTASGFDVHTSTSDTHDEGVQKRSPVMPRRSPPPPPSSREQLQSLSPESEKEMQHSRPSHGTKGNSSGGGPLGAFWSTQHAHDSQVVEDNPPIFDDERITFKHNHAKPEKRHSVHGNSLMGFNDSMADAFEINFSPEKTSSHAETKRSSQNETFNAFNINLDSFTPNRNSRSGKEEKLEAEVARLREQLKQTNLEKAEITSKYEKLSAICSFQGQELQELKQVLAASSPPPRKDNLKTPEPLQREKIEGTVWGDLHKGMLTNSPSSSPEPNQWQAFAEEPKTQATTTPETVNPKSVRTSNGHRNSIKQPTANPAMDEWGFGHDSFKADTSPASVISRGSSEGSTSQRFSWGETKKAESSQPVGWAGF